MKSHPEVSGKALVVTGVLALALLAGCNTTPTMTDGTAQPEPGRDVYRISRTVDEINQGVQRDRKASADMNQRLALLEGEIRHLRGTVDELRHENSRLKDQAGVASVPVSAPPVPAPVTGMPLEMANPRAASTAGPVPPTLTPPQVATATPLPAHPAEPVAPGPAAANPPGAMRIVGNINPAPPPAGPVPPAATPPAPAAAAAKPAPVTAALTPAPAAEAPAAGPMTPEKAYDEAFVLLKSGQYDKAMPAFDAFLKQNRDHNLAANAQYWIGEMHFVQRRYTEALVSFNKVLVDWPKSDKIPASLLKIGFSFYELEDLANAKSSLERLIKDYPNSSAATPARQRLKLIQQKQTGPS